MITSKKCMKKQLLNLALARYHEVSDLVPWLMTQTSVLIIYDIMQKLHPLIACYNCDQNIKFIFEFKRLTMMHIQ